MEAENQLYAEKHGDGQGQSPPADRPQYTPTPEQQQQQQPGQFQGFPPYAASTTAAVSPYYAAPSGAGYAGGYGVPPASQQQQQQVTIVAANQAPTVYVQHVESYTGAIIYSCFTIWFFGNWIFGLIAFMLAGAYATVNSRHIVERRYCVTTNSSRFRGLSMEIRGVSVCVY